MGGVTEKEKIEKCSFSFSFNILGLDDYKVFVFVRPALE
jgi:hypothetical protein